jgi:hypothetical protein
MVVRGFRPSLFKVDCALRKASKVSSPTPSVLLPSVSVSGFSAGGDAPLLSATPVWIGVGLVCSAPEVPASPGFSPAWRLNLREFDRILLVCVLFRSQLGETPLDVGDACLAQVRSRLLGSECPGIFTCTLAEPQGGGQDFAG